MEVDATGVIFGKRWLGCVCSSFSCVGFEVLVADPGNWCENYIFQKDTNNAPAKFYFYNDYVDSAKTFLESKKYESYDVLISLNEKIPENRRVVAFYKTKPSLKSETYIRNRIETRILQNCGCAQRIDLAICFTNHR